MPMKDKYQVIYCQSFGMLKDRYDKYEYDNIEDAMKRKDYLCSLSAEDILKEGFEFVPNWIRILSITSSQVKEVESGIPHLLNIVDHQFLGL